MAYTLAEIVARFGGELHGDGARQIETLAALSVAGKTQLSFLANPKFSDQLAGTEAAAVVLRPEMLSACPTAAIVTPLPYLYYARLSQWLAPPAGGVPGIHPSAVLASSLPASTTVAPHACIGSDVIFGENVVIGAHCRIGDGVEIAAGSRLYPGVTVYHGCRIGRRAIIHAGAVIGADGFGFAPDENQQWTKIIQSGTVVIGDDVEIGANTTIDRGALGDTVIADGVKLDNQIQVGHNVYIGEHSAMAGCVGIAGSARIGARCTVGGGAIILGHLTLADDVHIKSGTLVAKSIRQRGEYCGAVPFLPHAEWLKNFSHLRQLQKMADKIRALEQRLQELEKKS